VLQISSSDSKPGKLCEPETLAKSIELFFQTLLVYQARCLELRSLMKGGVFGGGNSRKGD